MPYMDGRSVDGPDRELESGRNASIETDAIHGCKGFAAGSAWRNERGEFGRGAVDDRSRPRLGKCNGRREEDG